MTFLDELGGKALSLRNRIADHFQERRMNIRTTGRRSVEIVDAVPYSTFAYHGIARVLDRLQIGPGDVLVDAGCGKGRVVCAAARRPADRIVGIEVDATLCGEARRNAQAMRGRHAPIQIVHAPAQAFDYIGCTALFMFNPFGPGTLAAVLDAIRAARPNASRFRLAYVNPRFDDLVGQTGWLERYDHWPRRSWSRLKFEVSFWRAIPDR